MINFNSLAAADYYAARFSILLKTENSVALPYLDKVGHPTIGIGFDLTVKESLDAVLTELAGKLLTTANSSKYTALQTIINTSYSSNTALRTAINNKMSEFNLSDPTIPATLAFASDSDPQIKTVLDTLVEIYETRVDTWLAGIPPSAERAVLVSLSYNGGLGPNLKAYIDNGDRALAWYEIRYATNGGDSASAGLANRRYVESERFGLFSDPSFPQVPTQQEAHQAAVMYTLNRSAILDYEAKYSPLTAATTKAELGIQDIYREMMPAIFTLKSEHNIPTSFVIEEVQMLALLGGLSNNLNGDGTAYDNSKNDQDLLIGNSAANTLNGGNGNDALVGNGGNDTLIGGSGDDILDGGTGNDTMNGGLGKDTLSGSDGDDYINGGKGNDNIYGGAGGDTLNGGDGNDDLFGGDGADVIIGDKGSDILTGGAGNDRFVINNGDSNNASDNITDREAGDRIVYNGVLLQGKAVYLGALVYQLGNIFLHKIENDLYVTSGDGASAVSVNNFFPSNSPYEPSDYTMMGITIPHVTQEPVANSLSNSISKNVFSDVTITDMLRGGAEDHIFTGEAGADVINGGTDFDWVSYATSSAAVNVNLGLSTAQSGGDAQGDILSSLGNILGSSYNDTLTGNTIANILSGGIGKDTLTGKAGADVFKYSTTTDSGTTSTTRDLITDFVNGTDRIDLADFAGTFAFKGTGAFTGTAREVNYSQVGGNTLIGIDADGNGTLDLQIELSGLHTMTTSDFLL